jgi:hypothetical protein
MEESTNLPYEVYNWLDFMQEQSPQSVLAEYRRLQTHAQAATDVGRLLFDSYGSALGLLPRDSQGEPGLATRVYEAFADSGNEAEKIYIVTQLVNLMPFDPRGTSNILRRVINDASEDELLLRESVAGMLDLTIKSGNWVPDPDDKRNLRLQRALRRPVA